MTNVVNSYLHDEIRLDSEFLLIGAFNYAFENFFEFNSVSFCVRNLIVLSPSPSVVFLPVPHK